MNGGVIRGAGLGYAYAFRTRVGFRLTGYNFKYSSVSDLGFRCGVGVNGVRADRGGRWGLGSDYIRCSYRDRSSQGSGGDKVGFR